MATLWRASVVVKNTYNKQIKVHRVEAKSAAGWFSLNPDQIGMSV